jgi:hypothetical protein
MVPVPGRRVTRCGSSTGGLPLTPPPQEATPRNVNGDKREPGDALEEADCGCCHEPSLMSLPP